MPQSITHSHEVKWYKWKNKWRYDIVSANGQVITRSKSGYATRASGRRALYNYHMGVVNGTVVEDD